MKSDFVALLIASSLAIPDLAPSRFYDETRDPSPLILLEAPRDGVAYYAKKEKARALTIEKRWEEAEPLWTELARDYPRDAENWTRLAEALEAQKKFAEAIEARKKAGAIIGWNVDFENGYLVAADQVAAGDRRAALETLRWMIFQQHGIHRAGLYDWPQFEALRKDPEFLAMIGRVDTRGWDRTRGWRYDIDFLRSEVKRGNPDFRNGPLPAEFERRCQQLKRDVPKLSDEEIYVGMGRILATLHQGHVSINNFPNDRFLPIRLYAFPDGIYIIGAGPEHQDLIGSRIVSFGTLPAATALSRLADALSVDGEMQYLWGVYRLIRTSYLKGIGAIRSTDAVTLALQAPDGTNRTVRLPTTGTRPPETQADRQDKLAPPPGKAPPLFLSNMKEVHWTRALPEHDALYVQINNLLDDDDETLEHFGARLPSLLKDSGARNLIIDLRHNNGGTTQKYPNLIKAVSAFSQVSGNQVYALIGRRSFSATGNFVTDLERLADPIFVGEATSECCNLYGDPGTVVLPYSKVSGELTNIKWQLSSAGDQRREMSPEVPVQLTAADYFAGRDPVLAAVFTLIDRRARRR